ncbi:MAG: RNA polymerase sigma factor [Bacillota bacterium]
MQGKIKTVRLTGRRSKKGAVIIDELAAINRVLAGDKQAFRPLVEAYSRLVFTSVVKIVRDSEAAQDIAQEAFLQAYRSLANFRSESAFSTWLVRIAINKALDYCRRQRRLPRMEEIPEGLPGDGCGPEGQVLAQEEVWRMRKQIQALPDIYRRVIYQYYFQERSYREIAQNEGITVKAVESRLYRAKALLRKSMAGGDGNVSAP